MRLQSEDCMLLKLVCVEEMKQLYLMMNKT
jgi:hypothetical protein